MSTGDHQSMMLGLKAGDRESWLTLYDTYVHRLWKNVARLVDDPALVPDIVQETMLSAAQSAAAYDTKRGSPWLWLWGIARRKMALHHRRRQRSLGTERLRAWWESLDGSKRMLVTNLEAPVNLLASRELAELVRYCLGHLDAEYQLLLLGKYLDNRSTQDIAGQLACSNEAVRSKLARARKAFRREFNRVTESAPVTGK